MARVTLSVADCEVEEHHSAESAYDSDALSHQTVADVDCMYSLYIRAYQHQATQTYRFHHVDFLSISEGKLIKPPNKNSLTGRV